MKPEVSHQISDDVIRKLQSRLNQVAYRQLGNGAEDLVQETLFIFFENIHHGKYRGGCSYPEYFCYALGILKVIIIKEIKKKQKNRAVTSSEDPAELADQLASTREESGEQAILKQEREEWTRLMAGKAREVFQSFPEHIQQLIYLHLIEDWSYSRLASHFGVSKQTLVSRFNTYLEKLRIKMNFPHTISQNEYLLSENRLDGHS